MGRVQDAPPEHPDALALHVEEPDRREPRSGDPAPRSTAGGLPPAAPAARRTPPPTIRRAELPRPAVPGCPGTRRRTGARRATGGSRSAAPCSTWDAAATSSRCRQIRAKWKPSCWSRRRTCPPGAETPGRQRAATIRRESPRDRRSSDRRADPQPHLQFVPQGVHHDATPVRDLYQPLQQLPIRTFRSDV